MDMDADDFVAKHCNFFCEASVVMDDDQVSHREQSGLISAKA